MIPKRPFWGHTHNIVSSHLVGSSSLASGTLTVFFSMLCQQQQPKRYPASQNTVCKCNKLSDCLEKVHSPSAEQCFVLKVTWNMHKSIIIWALEKASQCFRKSLKSWDWNPEPLFTSRERYLLEVCTGSFHPGPGRTLAEILLFQSHSVTFRQKRSLFFYQTSRTGWWNLPPPTVHPKPLLT